MRRPLAALALSALSLTALTALAPQPGRAQEDPQKVLQAPGGLNLASIKATVAKGDAEAAAGKLPQAKADYDQARLAAQRHGIGPMVEAIEAVWDRVLDPTAG